MLAPRSALMFAMPKWPRYPPAAVTWFTLSSPSGEEGARARQRVGR
jgi:hypothetical protein